MYDIALWLGGVNIFLVLVIVIVGIVSVWWMIRSLSWIMAQLRGSRDRVQATDTPKVGDLFSELKLVTDWYQLGIYLGLQTHELMQIEHDHQGNERRKQKMLDAWLRRKPDAGWRDVVSALQQNEENRVAERIRQNYVRGESTARSIQGDHGTAVEMTWNNQRKMETKFAMLLMNTCRTLKEKLIDVEDFQMFLTGYFPSECIPKSSNIHEIFEAITRQKLWDYLNYRPLEEIVKRFAADDPEVTSWVETYKQDLKSYKVTTKLIDHIAATSAESIPPSEEEQPARYDQQHYERLSFKLKMKFTDHTLDYIDDLWNEYAELYGLPPYMALLDCISEGCVWLIPSHLASQIRSTTPLSADFYRKHEITRVELGEECIYQEKEEHQKVETKLMKEEHEKEIQELKEKMKEEHKKELQVLKEQMKEEHENELQALKANSLHKAASRFDMDTLQRLINKGADVNSKDDDGWTPLLVAAERGHIDIVRYLVGQGADINIKDKNGRTPLHFAARENYERTVECLVDKGADINIRDVAGQTPLHIAAGKGYQYTTEYLVAKGADINMKDNDGQTPLHIASENGYKYTVKALAAEGADISAKDNAGMSPLDVAVKRGHVKVEEFLRDAVMSDVHETHNFGIAFRCF